MSPSSPGGGGARGAGVHGPGPAGGPGGLPAPGHLCVGPHRQREDPRLRDPRGAGERGGHMMVFRYSI